MLPIIDIYILELIPLQNLSHIEQMGKLSRFSKNEWMDFICGVYNNALRVSTQTTLDENEVDLFIAQMETLKDVVNEPEDEE